MFRSDRKQLEGRPQPDHTPVCVAQTPGESILIRGYPYPTRGRLCIPPKFGESVGRHDMIFDDAKENDGHCCRRVEGGRCCTGIPRGVATERPEVADLERRGAEAQLRLRSVDGSVGEGLDVTVRDRPSRLDPMTKYSPPGAAPPRAEQNIRYSDGRVSTKLHGISASC